MGGAITGPMGRYNHSREPTKAPSLNKYCPRHIVVIMLGCLPGHDGSIPFEGARMCRHFQPLRLDINEEGSAQSEYIVG